MKKRFTEEQIIAVLKEQEANGKTADVCRRHGISPATFYNWKAKFSVNVQLNIEIQANSRDGFDQILQRTIKENCSVLKFKSAEFEGE